MAKKSASSKTARKTNVAAPAQSTGFWLMKSEPESYSIDDFARDKKTLWTGVRNYQARNFMMNSMRVGDSFLFYQSNAEPSGAIGIGKISRVSVADPRAVDPKSDCYDPKASAELPIWFCAEVTFVEKFERVVALEEIRARRELATMALLRPGQRLSVMPIEKVEFEIIRKMATEASAATQASPAVKAAPAAAKRRATKPS